MTDSNITRIAVDAMGGDHAPEQIVAGAVAAAQKDQIKVTLVGDPIIVQSELSKHDTADLEIKIVPSEGVIDENEPPALALRQKPKASIIVANGLVKAGIVDGLVTMGSTGAAMATGAVVLGLLEGMDRPTIGGPIIGLAPKTVVVDLGANVDCKPSQLLSFAVIGGVLANVFWGTENPSVALLSVGSESGKGNRQIRETTELFNKSPVNFVGNLEANDLPLGNVDVAVTDGFSGNIIMKLTEGLGSGITELIENKLDGKVAKSTIDDLTKEIYSLTNVVESHGGGPLLGVKGISVIGHGRAKLDSVQRAIRTASQMSNLDFISKQEKQLQKIQGQIKG